MSTSAEFQQALDLYKRNYVQYRATGQTAYKIAYENADRWITNYLASLNRDIATDSTRIMTFLQEYANANPELTDLQSRFQMIRKEGPALEDKYTTVRRLQTEVPPVDTTSHYVKAGLIVVLMGLIGLFSR